MTKETVGKISHDLSLKEEKVTHSAEEQMREQLEDYERNIADCVTRCKKELTGDFYVVVITKKERLMHNVIRNYFTGRSSCPTPEWDQTVYRYNRADEYLEYLWVVPSKDTCEFMTLNVLNIPTEQKPLLQHVLDFNDGTLLRLSKKLNGEEAGSPLLIT